VPAIVVLIVGFVFLLRPTAPEPVSPILQGAPASQAPVARAAPPRSQFSRPQPSRTPTVATITEETPSEKTAATRGTTPPQMPASARPLVAIIMDDLGRELGSARTLLGIDLPVTFAILPGEAKAAQVAQLAYQHGREVLIHIPMEPQSYPITDPGDDALLVDQSPEELRRRFHVYLQQVPHASGANNHMGSRFTEHAEGLATVFAEMKQAGLFFVDSRTSSKSVALSGAHRAGLRALGRDVFLDNIQDVERIAAEIRKLVAVAEKRGQAVGICHPYPQTMEALRRETTFLRGRVEVVPVSRLLP
jgi:uncharacterized protein